MLALHTFLCYNFKNIVSNVLVNYIARIINNFIVTFNDLGGYMERISNFIYCLKVNRKEGAIAKKQGIIDALGVMSVINLDKLPVHFSFSIIFSVLGVNAAVKNTIRIIFKKCDNGKVLVDTGDQVLPARPEVEGAIDLPKEYRGVNISMDLPDIFFGEEGLYCTEIFFNNISLGENTIYVKSKGRLS